MMRTTVTTRWISAAVAAGAAFALTACSGGGGENGADQITVLHAPINYEALYLAEQEGFFDEVDLDVEIKPGGTAQDNLGQMAGGSADISILSWDVSVTASAEGVPLKIISSNAIISNDFDTSGVFVRADSGIETMADLEGGTIAFNSLSSGGNIPVFQAMEADGMDPDSVEVVAIPFASMESALENKQVDAVFPSDSFFSRMDDNDDYAAIAHPSREFRGGLPITLWGVTEQWLAENEDVATRFNEAIAKGIEFYADPANEQAVLEVRSEVSGQPIEDLEPLFVEFSTETDAEVAQSVTDALVHFDVVTDPLPVDEILWDEAPRS